MGRKQHAVCPAVQNSLGSVEKAPWVKSGMSFERYMKLRAIGEDSELGYRVTLERICSETCRYLETLGREVREGKNVVEAANFARWLRFSGVLDLFSRYALPDQTFPAFERKIVDLLDACGEHFRGGRTVPNYDQSDIAEISRKLDVLLAVNARPVVTTVVTQVRTLPEPANHASCASDVVANAGLLADASRSSTGWPEQP